MTRKTLLLLILILIAIVEMVFIRPLVPAFFGMTKAYQVFYIGILYGFPLLIAIPLGILVMPFALLFRRQKTFRTSWFRYLHSVHFVFISIILLVNTLLVVSKYAFNNDTFPLVKYSDIKVYDGNVEDLRTGTFESPFGLIERYEDKQVETYNRGYSNVLSIEWLSDYQYRLINHGDSRGMNDTLDVKITNNTLRYYECYVRFGEYAEYMKIEKK